MFHQCWCCHVFCLPPATCSEVSAAHLRLAAAFKTDFTSCYRFSFHLIPVTWTKLKALPCGQSGLGNMWVTGNIVVSPLFFVNLSEDGVKDETSVSLLVLHFHGNLN